MSEFHNEIKRVARKEHKCGECRVVIDRGQEYFSHSYSYDGRVYSFKMCLSCNALAHEYDKYLDHWGILPEDSYGVGYMFDDIFQLIGTGVEVDFAKQFSEYMAHIYSVFDRFKFDYVRMGINGYENG